MVRRWSCLKNLSLDNLYKRFEQKKLIKALNFRHYHIGITRFKRKKLSKWKRLTNSAIILQVMKYWIRDYFFIKKLTRAEVYEMMFKSSFSAQDGLVIKDKNPLTYRSSFFFFQNATSHTSNNYFFKKYTKIENSFEVFKKYQKNTLSSFTTTTDLPFSSNSDPFLFLMFIKAETDLFSLYYDNLNLEKILSFFSLLKVNLLSTYKVFTYLLFINAK